MIKMAVMKVVITVMVMGTDSITMTNLEHSSQYPKPSHLHYFILEEKLCSQQDARFFKTTSISNPSSTLSVIPTQPSSEKKQCSGLFPHQT